VATAYYLTRSKLYDPAVHSITILEACDIAAGSSSKGGGFIAAWAIPKCIAPLSFELHKRLAEEHGGENLWGFRTVYTAETKLNPKVRDYCSLADVLNWPLAVATKTHTWVFSSHTTPDVLHWLSPGSVEEYREIGTLDSTGQLHPKLLTNVLCTLAQEKGIKAIFGKATAINYDINSSAVKSVTDKTRDSELTLEATDVLVAAGPWSAPLLPVSIDFLYPNCHSIVVRPKKGDPLSPHILFKNLENAPDIYPRPKDLINDFETLYVCGPDTYGESLPPPGHCRGRQVPSYVEGSQERHNSQRGRRRGHHPTGLLPCPGQVARGARRRGHGPSCWPDRGRGRTLGRHWPRRVGCPERPRRWACHERNDSRGQGSIRQRRRLEPPDCHGFDQRKGLDVVPR
jgi:glycine/D-amino acid oxidase-like deaminating enzyme